MFNMRAPDVPTTCVYTIRPFQPEDEVGNTVVRKQRNGTGFTLLYSTFNISYPTNSACVSFLIRSIKLTMDGVHCNQLIDAGRATAAWCRNKTSHVYTCINSNHFKFVWFFNGNSTAHMRGNCVSNLSPCCVPETWCLECAGLKKSTGQQEFILLTLAVVSQ